MNSIELNMDGLVGPTHNYAGLAEGNLASTRNALTYSNPRAAAQQGLAKMRLLHKIGLPQAILPPHQRPNLKLLHQMGFTGTPAEQISKAYKAAPTVLYASYSAASMWAANTATITSSLDTNDAKVHFTAANLISNLHRQQEARFSKKLLQYIFSNPDFFIHHPILPSSYVTSDEGAANHSRLSKNHSHPGIHLFIYGRTTAPHHEESIRIKYPIRQTKEAFDVIIRSHQLDPTKVVFAQQNPIAINAGVFHNDVISVGNESLFLMHQHSFLNQSEVVKELHAKTLHPLNIIELNEQKLDLNEAVSSYFFNSQIITLPNSENMILVAPMECQINPRVKECIDELICSSENPLNSVYYLDLKQSMRNGGGPACLRLRVPLTTQEFESMHQGTIINDLLLDELEQWILKHYRNELSASDLIDPDLINENLHALDELTTILNLGSIYPFQTE